MLLYASTLHLTLAALCILNHISPSPLFLRDFLVHFIFRIKTSVSYIPLWGCILLCNIGMTYILLYKVLKHSHCYGLLLCLTCNFSFKIQKYPSILPFLIPTAYSRMKIENKTTSLLFTLDALVSFVMLAEKCMALEGIT